MERKSQLGGHFQIKIQQNPNTLKNRKQKEFEYNPDRRKTKRPKIKPTHLTLLKPECQKNQKWKIAAVKKSTREKLKQK